MENSEKSKKSKTKTKHIILTVSFGLILFLTGLSIGSIISKQHSDDTPANNTNSSFVDSKQPVENNSDQNPDSDKSNNSDQTDDSDSRQNSDINSTDNSKQPVENNSDQNPDSDKSNNSDQTENSGSKQNSDINNTNSSKQPNSSDHLNTETKPTPSPKPSSAPKPTKQPAASPTPAPSKKPTSAVSSDNGSVSANGQLKVIGTNLCNSAGNPIVLHGISTAGIAWFPDLATKEFMQTLHDEWATTIFRIAMYSFEGNDSYINNPEWNKKKVCSLIDAAIELDQYVIVDWHILADGNPQTYQKQAIEFFTYIASRYAKVPNILYEICNEPNGGTNWSNNIKPYAETVIPVIREYSPEAVILVGTPTWSQDVDAAAADPLSFDNIMYSLHFYAGTHKQWLRDKATAALKKGLPLFATEWGTTDASGNGAVDKASTLEWLDFLDQNQISWCNWSLCNKAESSALLKPSAGTTGAMPESSLTESGAFVKEQMLARSNFKPSDNTDKSTDKDTNSKPSDNTDKNTDKDTNSKPSNNTDKDAEKDTNSKPSDNTEQGGLMLYSYNENRDVSTNTLSPRFQLKNTSDHEIELYLVSFRYYYTPESDVEQNFWCDYADINGGTYRAITDFVTAEFHSGVESYMEISFAENIGMLLPGETATLQVRITNADWSNYDQSNDSSFNADSNSYLFTEEIK